MLAALQANGCLILSFLNYTAYSKKAMNHDNQGLSFAAL